MRFINLITIPAIGMVFAASSVLAEEPLNRDPKPGEPGWVDIPASFNRIPPPNPGYTPNHPSYSTFVVDQGAGLDTGCTFRSGGPLIITLPVDIGNHGVLGTDATLNLAAYDVDFASGEHDRVSFNGHVVSNPGQFLTGFDNNWEVSRFAIPATWINSHGSNTIQIDIDVDSFWENWCTAIDWAALSFPLVVDLNSFTATPTDTGVNLEWETATEMNNLGMNLWCAQVGDGQFEAVTKLNSQLIPSKALPNSGASYSSADYPGINTNLNPGVQHCALEDIDASGQCTVHCDQMDTVVIGNNLPATELNRLKAEAIALCKAHELNGVCLDQLVAPANP